MIHFFYLVTLLFISQVPNLCFLLQTLVCEHQRLISGDVCKLFSSTLPHRYLTVTFAVLRRRIEALFNNKLPTSQHFFFPMFLVSGVRAVATKTRRKAFRAEVCKLYISPGDNVHQTSRVPSIVRLLYLQ